MDHTDSIDLKRVDKKGTQLMNILHFLSQEHLVEGFCSLISQRVIQTSLERGFSTYEPTSRITGTIPLEKQLDPRGC